MVLISPCILFISLFPISNTCSGVRLTDILKLKEADPESAKILQQIKENILNLYNGTRDILWSLNNQSDDVYETIEHLKDIGTELFQYTSMDFEYEHNVNPQSSKLKLDITRNLIMVFKEIYNNILKHSNAAKVSVKISISDSGNITLFIRDNGKSFKTTDSYPGNGLKNIRNRVIRMNGVINISSVPGEGTEIKIDLPNNSIKTKE